MTARLLLLAGIFFASTAYSRYAMEPELIPLRQPLADIAYRVGEWQGQNAPPFSEDILAVLGVDEYLNRVYVAPSGIPVGLYVGYYQSQRKGDAIHSPANCLPGAGWLPVSSGRITVSFDGRSEPVEVNRYVIQKGLDRQVVLYWYQSHGRVVASEYMSKAYLIYDSVRLNRSEAAMIRVISPILPSEPDDRVAEQRAVDFARTLFPILTPHLPS